MTTNQISSSVRQTGQGTFLSRIVSLLRASRCLASDNHRMKSLPSDRLDDMGIAPRTDANARSSGEAGPIPRADLW
ncbi:hypothetical protein CLV78_10980 [Aliiruegeria haliotis]|uniref:Uncharacterized protein n=1 Tax=Aliiruegeria haliotis TaxID=1280846 RepID=A0A2T0RK19_9RHOB|nr:hypothetical protein CLV78_10980 [Aliiruegeria haliotis]